MIAFAIAGARATRSHQPNSNPHLRSRRVRADAARRAVVILPVAPTAGAMILKDH